MLTHRGGAAEKRKWAETAIWTALESEDLSRISSRNVSPQELLPFMRRFVEIGTIGEEYVGTRERQRLRRAGRGRGQASATHAAESPWNSCSVRRRRRQRSKGDCLLLLQPRSVTPFSRGPSSRRSGPVNASGFSALERSRANAGSQRRTRVSMRSSANGSLASEPRGAAGLEQSGVPKEVPSTLNRDAGAVSPRICRPSEVLRPTPRANAPAIAILERKCHRSTMLGHRLATHFEAILRRNDDVRTIARRFDR